MKLSHSAVEKYNQCSELYRLHYIAKIREEKTNSNLTFGAALDEGLNDLLRTKLAVKPEVFPTPLKAFMEKWQTVDINGIKYDARFCTLIEYSKKDLDLNLFTESDYALIKDEYPEESPAEFAAEIEAQRAIQPWWSYAKMDDNAKIAYNFLCWISLARKAQLIFEAYVNEILPQIRQVTLIQEEISLENDEGDSVTGFIDFIAEWEDGNVYIMDNKTTSDFKYYKADSVKLSNQLSLYGFAKDIKKAGYVAILKEIKADGRKKGSLPKVKIKVVLDDISEEHQNKTLAKFNITNKKIKAKEFKKLEDESLCMAYGKKCPMAGLCWRNSMEGLIKKEDNKRPIIQDSSEYCTCQGTDPCEYCIGEEVKSWQK